MAQEPERITIQVRQYSQGTRIYHTKYLLAQGATGIIVSDMELDGFPELTQLGRLLIERLRLEPGIEQVLMLNYQIYVNKTEDAYWSTAKGLDRLVLMDLSRLIIQDIERHRHALAELMGEDPDALPQLDLEVHISGTPPPHDAPAESDGQGQNHAA